jgi:hypothetical protein
MPAMRRLAGLLVVVAQATWATTYQATPATLNGLLPQLVAGDRLELAAGTYAHFTVNGLNGTPIAWIDLTGPESGAPAVIQADPGPCCNTVELVSSSYVAVRHLTIDNLGVQGAFAVSAKSGLVHHIRIEDNHLVFTNADQNDCGISTKVPTWGWEIRRNVIERAGTGLYLGNSDGTRPFVQGLIEDNLVVNPVGYDMEIKHQVDWPTDAGLPAGPTTTFIRHNVFIKGDGPSPAGDRPNVLFDGFPDTGPGADNHYEVSGNLFFHNPREALLQVSGSFSIHDNLFVDASSVAVRVTTHAGKAVKRAYLYDNTVLSAAGAIEFDAAATIDDLVAGNLLLATTGTSGTIAHARDNLVTPPAMAGTLVGSGAMTLPGVDLFPVVGSAAHGAPVDLSVVAGDVDGTVDFNGAPKGDFGWRGAYAGQGMNCGWLPAVAVKALGGTCAGDGGVSDAGMADAGADDAGTVDAGGALPSDGGTAGGAVGSCGCRESAGSSGLLGALMLVGLARRRTSMRGGVGRR